jgi:hypothetical protein
MYVVCVISILMYIPLQAHDIFMDGTKMVHRRIMEEYYITPI